MILGSSKVGYFQAGASRFVGHCSLAIVVWRSGTTSKSSAYIWIQPCLWMLKWRRWSRHPTSTSVLSDTFAEVRVYQDDRLRSHHFSARLLQLISVRHFNISANSIVFRMILCELCYVTSSLEFQFKTVAKTATLASSPSEDNIQDRSSHSTFNVQSSEQPSYLQSAGQILHSFTEP